MDLRSLRYFIAVVEAGSLSRAAHSLYVAQPALTAQIKKLEGELSAQLLERSHAGVTPTPAGNQLYQDAQRLLSDAEAMRERIKHLPQGPEGSVTVAVPFLLTSLLMGPVIARLRAQHPRLRVFVIDGLSRTVEKAMLDGRADLGILVDTPGLGDLICTPLAEEAMYICGHDQDGSVAPLLREQPGSTMPAMAFADAARLPLVLQPRRHAIRQTVEAAAQAQGLRLNIAHEHDSARVIRSLYHCGAGFAFSPACSLADVPPWQLPRPRPHPPEAAGPSGQARRRKPASQGDDPPGRATRAPAGWVVAQVVEPVLLRQYTLAMQARRSREAATQAVLAALAEHAHALMAQGIWRARALQSQHA